MSKLRFEKDLSCRMQLFNIPGLNNNVIANWDRNVH